MDDGARAARRDRRRLNNRSYAILNIELERVGAGAAGARAKSLLDLANPNLDFVSIGNGMGVPSVRVATGQEFTAALELASRTRATPHRGCRPARSVAWKPQAMGSVSYGS